MNYARFVVALILLSVGFLIGERWNAADVVRAEKSLSDYKASVLQQVTQQQNATAHAAQQRATQQQQEDKAHAQRLASLQSDNDRLADRLRPERVRVCAPRPEPMPAADSGASGRADSPAGADLHAAAGIDLVRLARDADAITAALRICLAHYPAQ